MYSYLYFVHNRTNWEKYRIVKSKLNKFNLQSDSGWNRKKEKISALSPIFYQKQQEHSAEQQINRYSMLKYNRLSDKIKYEYGREYLAFQPHQIKGTCLLGCGQGPRWYLIDS